jgi:hypothetical protein
MIRLPRPWKRVVHNPIIFAYWDSDDHSILTEMISAWRSHFPQFRVLGDRDILPLIERLHSPIYVNLYNKIRFPSIKSEIARYLALYEFGGLYVDCHNGIRNVDEINRLLIFLNDYDAIIIDRRISFYPRPPGEHFLISAPIFGRHRSELFMIFARQTFANLVWQQHLEQQYGFVFNDCARLSGPNLITEVVLEPGSCNRNVRADFAGRIMIVPEETAPMVRNAYTSYKAPESHWTRRQLSEPLFEPVREPAPSPDVRFHNLFQAEYRAVRARIRAEIEALRHSSEGQAQ